MEKTYKSRGVCSNCDFKSDPQWGTYEVGKLVSDYPCPNCECKTLHADIMANHRKEECKE